MSQWGQILEISGAQLQPLVNGAPFSPINSEQTVVDVVPLELSSEFGDPELQALRAEFVGLPYSRWLDRCGLATA